MRCARKDGRNTDTKEVVWELPAGAELAGSASAAPAVAEETEGEAEADGAGGGPSFAEMLEALVDAAANDPNAFGSVANGFRSHGVFGVEFMEHLEGELKAARADHARAEVLQKVQARIVNPLLKQGEFY